MSQDLGRRGFLGIAGAGVAGTALGAFAPTNALAVSGGGGSTRPVVVGTRSGRVRGIERSDGVLVWKGMPYAAPPTGSRRYAPPQRPASWTGVRDASAYGHAAPQVPLLPGLPQTPNQSEDCLFLNVWSPSTGGKKGR